MRSLSIAIAFCIAIVFSACSPNNVTVDNSLEKHFTDNKLQGCFALYNNNSNQFTIFNLSRYKDSAYSPASTFKIVNSLIAIHTGRAFNEKMVIKWDGVSRWNADWNKDLDMEEAFKVSAVPYYQELARRIGKDTMKLWLDSLNYGNRTIGNHVDSFWLNNTLTITADEQLGLVKRLYFDQLPIDKRAQRIVRQMMLREKNANYLLSYKTGTGTTPSGKTLGWVVGWIEENRHPYFFVLNVEGDSEIDMTTARMNALKGILKQLGFLEGKM